MSEIGQVIAVMDDTVQVRIPRSERCRGCRACNFITKDSQMELYARNECSAKIGDFVEVEVKENGELSSTMLLYGIPLLVFLVSILIFSRFLPELATIGITFALTALCYAGIHFLSKHLDRKPYMPSAVKKA